MKSTGYRGDIDGLRAVAVLLVVLYHLGIGPDGGFIGVDIFFVISGFLITGILRNDLRAGTFSFSNFYMRRARRILPALVAVCLVSLVAGWFLLLPADLKLLGAQAAAAVLGVANIYFWLNTGYFDQSAELLPLLHTWSLGVEEQFYLVWPLALLLAYQSRKIRRVNWWLVGGALLVASLVVAQLIVKNDPMAAFYLPFTRAWELGLGAAITYLPQSTSRRSAQAASLVGIVLIVASGLFYSSETEFPGLAAVLPCFGAALLLWPSSRASTVNKMLSLSPAVWVGKISYSLYLWHWPILVFAKHYNHGETISKPMSVVLLMVAVGISALCWKFVEQPFREKQLGWQLPAVLAGAVLLTGVIFTLQAGFPGRLSEKGQFIASFLQYSRPVETPGACFLGDVTPETEGTCAPPAGSKTVLLLGDSHARHYAHAFVDAFPGAYLSFATSSQCRPVLHSIGRERCVEVMQRIYKDLIPTHRYDAIILSARWRNGQSDQIAESVEYLKRFTDRVIIFGQTVEYPAALPDLLVANEILRAPVDLSIEPPRAASLRRLNAEIETEARTAGAEFYSPLDAICSNGSCQKTTPAGVPMESDYGHLTLEGSEVVLSRFKAAGLSF